jgi:oligopeptide transport system substrate-binding protein
MRCPCGLLAVLILFLSLISGCGNSPYPAGDTSRSVLYLEMPDDPKTLDPSVAYDVVAMRIVGLISSSYFRYHYLRRDPYVLELNLGAEQPKRKPYAYKATVSGHEVKRQGESWTFRIKKGLRFQNDPCFPGGKGREIKAADFAYSFRRMADPEVPCPVLSYFEDKVIGMHEYAEYNRTRAAKGLAADYQRQIEGLQLDPHDPYVFRVFLTRPYPQLRYLMAMSLTSPIPHEAPERYGAGFARHPVGCGPYILEEYSPKLKIVLKKNPNRNAEFYPADGMPGDLEAGLLEDAGRQLPLANEVVFQVVKEGLTAWNLFLQGYLDCGHSFGAMSVSQVMTPQGTLSKGMKDRGVSLSRSPNLAVWYFSFNMLDPVVGGYTPEKKKLRQAISLAIDRQALIDLRLQGLSTPAQFIVPPGVVGYEPNYRNPYSRHDVARAKKLLAEAGYPNGISRKTGERLTIYFDNTATSPAGRQLVGQISRMLQSIGIHLESRSYRYAMWDDKIKNRDYQFTHEGWIADYPDPENFALLLYGPNADNRGPNDSVYDNKEYNRLFEQMQVMDDGPKRQQIIRAMRNLAVEDCPCIYLDHDLTLMLHNQWLSNARPHPVALDSAKYYQVDGVLRASMQARWNKPNYVPLIAAVAVLAASILPAIALVRKRRNRRIRVGPGGTT